MVGSQAADTTGSLVVRTELRQAEAYATKDVQAIDTRRSLAVTQYLANLTVRNTTVFLAQAELPCLGLEWLP